MGVRAAIWTLDLWATRGGREAERGSEREKRLHPVGWLSSSRQAGFLVKKRQLSSEARQLWSEQHPGSETKRAFETGRTSEPLATPAGLTFSRVGCGGWNLRFQTLDPLAALATTCKVSALGFCGGLTILKLTSWASGTNPSTFNWITSWAHQSWLNRLRKPTLAVPGLEVRVGLNQKLSGNKVYYTASS